MVLSIFTGITQTEIARFAAIESVKSIRDLRANETLLVKFDNFSNLTRFI